MLIRNLMSSTSLFSYPRAAAGEGDGAGGDPPATTAAAGDSGEAGDGAPAAGEADPPAADPPVAAKDWRDREIASKHRQLQEEKRKAAEREARLAEIERENESLRAIAERRAATPQGDDEQPPAPSSRKAAAVAPDPDAVRQEAGRIVAKENYDRDCNAAFNKGKKDYGDKWDVAIERLQTFSGDDGAAMSIDTMVGILATDDPARVLFEMGNNPDEYYRIMALPPAKRLNEMAKIAAAPAPKKKVSEAPAPIDPVGGRGASVNEELDDKLSDDEWYKRREAQKRRKWEASQGIRRQA